MPNNIDQPTNSKLFFMIAPPAKSITPDTAIRMATSAAPAIEFAIFLLFEVNAQQIPFMNNTNIAPNINDPATNSG